MTNNKDTPPSGIEALPEWQLALDSGATTREVTELVAGTVREHRGDYTAPYTEGPIPAKLTAAERKAIRMPLARYAAARAAGYDDARARVHVDGPSPDHMPIGVVERMHADCTAAEEGLVWVPAAVSKTEAARVGPYVSYIILEQTGTERNPRYPTLGWWCLASVTAAPQAVP